MVDCCHYSLYDLPIGDTGRWRTLASPYRMSRFVSQDDGLAGGEVLHGPCLELPVFVETVDQDLIPYLQLEPRRFQVRGLAQSHQHLARIGLDSDLMVDCCHYPLHDLPIGDADGRTFSEHLFRTLSETLPTALALTLALILTLAQTLALALALILTLAQTLALALALILTLAQTLALILTLALTLTLAAT